MRQRWLTWRTVWLIRRDCLFDLTLFHRWSTALALMTNMVHFQPSPGRPWRKTNDVGAQSGRGWNRLTWWGTGGASFSFICSLRLEPTPGLPGRKRGGASQSLVFLNRNITLPDLSDKELSHCVIKARRDCQLSKKVNNEFNLAWITFASLEL